MTDKHTLEGTMKRIMIAVLMFVAYFGYHDSIGTPAYAQSSGFVNGEAKVDQTGTVQTVTAGWGQTLWGPLGISSFLLLSETWGEAYVGPTYSPIDGLTFSLSAGAKQESGDFVPRFGGSVYWGISSFSTLAIVEWGTHGEQDVWYKLLSTYSPADWLKVGIEGRRFNGFGPHLGVLIPHTPLYIWVSWVPVEPEGLDGSYTHLERVLAGAKIGF